jgi:hypothetical protein
VLEAIALDMRDQPGLRVVTKEWAFDLLQLRQPGHEGAQRSLFCLPRD